MPSTQRLGRWNLDRSWERTSGALAHFKVVGSPPMNTSTHSSLGGATLYAGHGNELGCIIRRGIVACQRRSHDQLVVQRAEADVRLRAHGHSAGKTLLA